MIPDWLEEVLNKNKHWFEKQPEFIQKAIIWEREQRRLEAHKLYN